MSIVNTYKALIKREFWEHRGAFIKTPIIVSIVLLAILIVGYTIATVFASETSSIEIMDRGINELDKVSVEQLNVIWDAYSLSISPLFLFILFIVNFFYLLGSLYDDRKDGSIQFWKSLPISDSDTVISKVLTALLFVPIVATLIFMLYLICNNVLGSMILLFHGQNPIKIIWAPSNVFGAGYTMLFGAFVQMLWALPIYGWLLFCSAWSNRRPFLFAMFIPLLVAVSWYVLNIITRLNFMQVDMFKLPAKYFLYAVLPYGANSGKGFKINLDDNTRLTTVLDAMKDSLSHIEILYGAIFAAIFIAISIWVRRYRNTT